MALEFWDQAGPAGRIALSVIGSLLGATLVWLIRLSWVWLRSRKTRLEKLAEIIKSLKSELKDLQNRLHGAESAVEGNGLWLARPTLPPDQYPVLIKQSIPVVAIANLKGGVGKTTLTAHLARYFAMTGKRVLAIDLDYQGSLSSLAAQGDQPTSKITSFVAGKLDGQSLVDMAWPMENSPEQARIMTSYYDLARIENQVMVHWLTRKEERDARYFLARAIHCDEVQKNFDIILIDAAPRITTSTVQALCASTHVLIPTKLDALSADAVGYFVRQLFIMDSLWPYLDIAGVVGAMTEENIGAKTESRYDKDSLVNFERDAILRMEERLKSTFHESSKRFSGDLILPYSTFVPGRRDISRLANEKFSQRSEVTAANRAVIEEVFERLGRELANRVGLPL